MKGNMVLFPKKAFSVWLQHKLNITMIQNGSLATIYYILYTIQLYNRRWAHKHQIATLNKIDSSVWEAVSERDTGLTI